MTRTRDLLITSEMHYRLCYTSIFSPIIIAMTGPNVNIILSMGTDFFDFFPQGNQVIKGFGPFRQIPQ